MSLKKRLFFRASHALATLSPNFFGLTEPYHEIQTDFALPGGAKVFLGAMLLDAPKGLYHRYDYRSICAKEQIALVVRTLEVLERETHLWGGVKAATEKQYEAIGVDVINISIRDFIAHFKHTEADFVPQFFQAMETIYAHQAARKNVYFHCKAGKNRSFKALTTYLVYVQCHDALKTKTVTIEQLKTIIHETCKHIHVHRPQIIYKTAKQREDHEAFVLAAFEAYLGK